MLLSIQGKSGEKVFIDWVKFSWIASDNTRQYRIDKWIWLNWISIENIIGCAGRVNRKAPVVMTYWQYSHIIHCRYINVILDAAVWTSTKNIFFSAYVLGCFINDYIFWNNYSHICKYVNAKMCKSVCSQNATQWEVVEIGPFCGFFYRFRKIDFNRSFLKWWDLIEIQYSMTPKFSKKSLGTEGSKLFSHWPFSEYFMFSTLRHIDRFDTCPKFQFLNRTKRAKRKNPKSIGSSRTISFLVLTFAEQ